MHECREDAPTGPVVPVGSKEKAMQQQGSRLERVIALSIGLGCVSGAVLALQDVALWEKAGIILLLGSLMVDAFSRAIGRRRAAVRF
jgi:hypothetical protein